MDDETRDWIARTDPERREALRQVTIGILLSWVQTVLLIGILAAIISK